jgi:hypothetical protein
MASKQQAWRGRWLALALMGSALLGCSRARVVSFDGSSPAIDVQRPALYPETVEYDVKADQFVLGSFRDGAIYRVDPAGQASLLVDDPRLCSVLGIALDGARDRLWAVSSDLGASRKPSAAGVKKSASVGIYELRTGKAAGFVDLSPLLDGPHLLNGIALDAAGTAYVTDSLSPVIYRVEAGGRASIFVRDERFLGDAINLNGVVVHPNGYLLVIKKSDGSLFKVPLAEPSKLTRVACAERLVGGDGLTAIDDKSLVVIANRTPQATSNAAYWLSSDDDWATAKLRARKALGDVYPTTAVLRQDTLYVLHSQLNELIGAPLERKSELHARASIWPIGHVER